MMRRTSLAVALWALLASGFSWDLLPAADPLSGGQGGGQHIGALGGSLGDGSVASRSNSAPAWELDAQVADLSVRRSLPQTTAARGSALPPGLRLRFLTQQPHSQRGPPSPIV